LYISEIGISQYSKLEAMLKRRKNARRACAIGLCVTAFQSFVLQKLSFLLMTTTSHLRLHRQVKSSQVVFNIRWQTVTNAQWIYLFSI